MLYQTDTIYVDVPVTYIDMRSDCIPNLTCFIYTRKDVHLDERPFFSLCGYVGDVFI